MAQTTLSRPENVSGDFYVDSTCIDCDLCRQLAPRTFHPAGDQAAVYRQPAMEEEIQQALKALVTCPTASIGARRRYPIQAAVQAFPEQVEHNVYFCGFASRFSFGASSYLIRRSEGNVLVDTPRFSLPLAKRVRSLGGIRWIFLTHRDDVADHRKWAEHFGAARVIHRHEVGPNLRSVEHQLEGTDPVVFANDLTAIPTPGHTCGHMVLLYGNRFLFSGDHLWWSPRRAALWASRQVCWYRWDEQVSSVARLLDYQFEWILPGHGRRVRMEAEQMRRELGRCLRRLQGV